MQQEARISYLCSPAATGRITLEELCELLSYITLDPEIWDLLCIEALLRKVN